MSVGDHQTLRVLEGRYVLQRAVSDVEATGKGEEVAARTDRLVASPAA